MDENFLKMLSSQVSKDTDHFGSLHTVFSSTGTKAQSLGARACFGNVLKYTHGHMHNTYTIITFKSVISGENNLCIFTKEEIENYLNYIAAFIPFTFTVTEFPYNPQENQLKREAHFEIFVDINGPHIQHVFILTLIRYLYETPYKYILLEAFRMKSVPEFSSINLLNLYNVILFSIDWYSLLGPRPSSDMSHYIGTNPLMLLTKKEISERILGLDAKLLEIRETKQESEYTRRRSVNAGCIDLFPILRAFNKDTSESPVQDWLSKCVTYEKYGFKFLKSDRNTKNYLLNLTVLSNTEEDFKERLEVYANNLQIIGSLTTEDIISKSKEYNLDHLVMYYSYED